MATDTMGGQCSRCDWLAIRSSTHQLALGVVEAQLVVGHEAVYPLVLDAQVLQRELVRMAVSSANPSEGIWRLRPAMSMRRPW
jgi:hypothetical protein